MYSIEELQREGLLPGGIRGEGTVAAFCVDTFGGDYVRLFGSEAEMNGWLDYREVHWPFHDHWGTPLEYL